MLNVNGLYAGILLATVAVCYYNAIPCGFVFDDLSAVRDNKDLRPDTPLVNLFWNDFWGTPMHKERSHKSYRPLCVLTFRWNYFCNELNPVGYHLVNVILHAVVSLLFFRVCQMLRLKSSISFLAALLFAVHPVHTEAVTGVVGRAELLCSIFYLLAFMSYIQSTQTTTDAKYKTGWWMLACSVLLVAVAMLCKEQGITVIGICCIYEIFIAQQMCLPSLISMCVGFLRGHGGLASAGGWLKVAALRAGLLVGSTILLMFARIRVMGAQLPVFTRYDNPAAASEFPERQLTYSYLIPLNIWLLLCPSWLCCDWTMGTIPVIESILDPRNLVTGVFYAGLFLLASSAIKANGQRHKRSVVCLALMALPFIPASNLFFPVGFVVAERVLYAPSMGFCLLVACGFEVLLSHSKRILRLILLVAMILLLVTHSLKTIVRNYDWTSEYSLFMAGLRVNNKNAKLFNNVGHALEGESRYDEALKYFVQAARVQPDDIGAHINVGRTYNTLKNYDESEKAYRLALSLLPPVRPGQSYTTRVAPNHLNVFINLGNLLSKNSSRLLEADALLRTAISMRSDFTQAYINRGDILMKLNRTREAQEQYETALKFEDDNPDLYYNLGVVLLEQGRQRDALQNFETALKFNPKHKQTLFNSAVLIQEIGDPKLRPEAYRRLFLVEKEEPENEKVYFNLAMLSMDDKKFEDAWKWFDKAIQLKPDFRSALFNVALLIANDMQRPLDAVPYLKQLLEFHPNHVKGLILMGDVNINHLKDVPAAEICFQRILDVEPDNIQAKHNLCVVYVEKGDLLRAERCLVDVQQLAPEETYIQQHLNIVRHRIAKIREMRDNRNV